MIMKAIYQICKNIFHAQLNAVQLIRHKQKKRNQKIKHENSLKIHDHKKPQSTKNVLHEITTTTTHSALIIQC